MTAWGYQDLGQVQRAQGRLDTAAGTYREALKVAAATSRTALPAAGIAYVGLAEVAYQRNELDTALGHVSEGIGACRQMNFTQPLATGLATLAWIRQAQGDEAGEGPPMAALLGRLVAAQRAEEAAARGVPLGWLARALGAFGEKPAAPGTGRGAATVTPGLAEQLTARELEVLALLAAGAPNPRIAEQLVVSLDTVKKHVSHLLGKLGAANRTEAVTRARQLGLIP